MPEPRADHPVLAVRVVIADDQPVVRLGMAQLIEAHGWQVCAVASDGREAVARVQEAQPDLLIMEYALAGLNGVQAAREIERSAAGTEVLLYTGARSRHALVQMFRCPARGCLLKTEAAEELIPALEAIRRYHTVRSRGFTELYQQIQATEGEIAPPTEREQEVLQLIADGLFSKEIAAKFSVTVKTIEHHRDSLKHKLRARSSAELVRKAIRFGLLEV